MATLGHGDAAGEHLDMDRGGYDAMPHVLIAFLAECVLFGSIPGGVAAFIAEMALHDSELVAWTGLVVAVVMGLFPAYWVFHDRWRCIEAHASRYASGVANFSVLYLPLVALVYANVRGARKLLGEVPRTAPTFRHSTESLEIERREVDNALQAARWILIGTVVLAFSLLAALADIQRWRAARELRTRASEACQTTDDAKACLDAIAAHHATCTPIGTYGTHWADGPRVDVPGYLVCLMNPTGPEEARSRHTVLFGCPTSSVEVFVHDPGSGELVTSGCGETYRWRCTPHPAESANSKFHDAPACVVAP